MENYQKTFETKPQFILLLAKYWKQITTMKNISCENFQSNYKILNQVPDKNNNQIQIKTPLISRSNLNPMLSISDTELYYMSGINEFSPQSIPQRILDTTSNLNQSSSISFHYQQFNNACAEINSQIHRKQQSMFQKSFSEQWLIMSQSNDRLSNKKFKKSTNLSQMHLSTYSSDSDANEISYFDNNTESIAFISPIEEQQLELKNGERQNVLLYQNRWRNKYPNTKKRIILKNGQINLFPEHVTKRGRRYLRDTLTTMVDIRWRWNLFIFSMGFVISWLAFAIIWWLIAFSHSDFEHIYDKKWTPCVTNVKNFASALLFSIETQHTIGYGNRFITDECPEALFIMCLQSIIGVIIQCFLVGFVFAKLSRPQKRSQTLMFSRYALINTRDSQLCLMFRIGDIRYRSHIIDAKISAQVIRKKVTKEGEILPYYHEKINVRFDHLENELFLIWPAIIVHVIDKHSPFYTVCNLY